MYYTTYNSTNHLGLASIQQRPQMLPEQLSLAPAGSYAAISLVSFQVLYGGGCVGGASSLRVFFQILPPLSAAWLAPLHISFSPLPPLPVVIKIYREFSSLFYQCGESLNITTH